MTQNEWQDRLTRVIAAEIRRWRRQRKLSTQQLAGRCECLGFSIPRSVLANLENGRRESVSVAEVLVLAAALDVAPVLLVNPLGHQPATEILPGRELSPWEAALWQSGEVRLREDGGKTEWLEWRDDQGVVPLYHRHDQLAEDLSGGGLWQAKAVIMGEDGRIDHEASMRLQLERRQRLEDDLRAVRARMRDLGLTPPELPEELAHIDSQERRRGSR